MNLAVPPLCVNRLEQKMLGPVSIFWVDIHLDSIKFAGYAASPVILSPLYNLQIGAVRWGCMAAILIAAMLAFMAGEPAEEGNKGIC